MPSDWLVSAAAAPVLAQARELLAAGDPLSAGAALRRRYPDLPADLAAAALEQADLGRRARERYGIDPTDLLLTRDGLEAATRPQVAARRARLLAAAGVRRVLDLTGGLGFDSSALAATGLEVTAVERDPGTATLLAHNCPGVAVVVADALEVLPDLLAGLSPTDAVFVDPARRDPGGPRDARTARALPERDPERWSPPWSAVAAIDHPRVLAKVAPGFAAPVGWQAEWTSVDRTVVECAIYSWPVLAAPRQAVVLDGATATVVPGDHDDAGRPAAAAGIGSWVHEPDPAVVRAGALGSLARLEGLLPIDPESTWLTGAHSSTSPALRSHLVVDRLEGSPREQRRRLADLGVTRAAVKCRDVATDPSTVLRRLGLDEGPDHVLIMTRHRGRMISLLGEPARARGH